MERIKQLTNEPFANLRFSLTNAWNTKSTLILCARGEKEKRDKSLFTINEWSLWDLRTSLFRWELIVNDVNGNLRRNRSVIITQVADEINSQRCKPRGGGYPWNFWVGICRWNPETLSLYQSYNLGQNKVKQLFPIPPKAMMKARRSKNGPFWHHWIGGRGGPDVSFILSKIVVQAEFCQ